jgi:membrane-associated phospholipid phosphatase
MRYFLGLLLMMAFGLTQLSTAQEAEARKLNVPKFSLPREVLYPPMPARGFESEKKEIYWKGWLRFGPNVLKDQKAIWTFPLSVATGKHLKPTFTVMGITAGLVALDPYSGRYFHRNQSFKGFNRAFSGRNTAIANFVAPIAFYGVSLIRRNSYDQKTFFLAGEAALSSAILTTVMKDLTRRFYPDDVPLNGNYYDTWFKKDWEHWKGGIGSFPSGHTSAAFSVATVFAKRYPNRRWVRWVAYGLAGLVGFSRISLESHFPSDVFVGAALGYAVAHNAVLRGP